MTGQPRDEARENSLHRLMRTFFDGSASSTVAAILDAKASELTDDELDSLTELIASARRRGQ